MFQRKVYQKLMIWKEKYASKQACLLEGARQVGKTTIAEHFAQNEYTSYIKIDFANTNRLLFLTKFNAIRKQETLQKIW